MFVRIAQRIGGFAGTTATRWLENGASMPELPTPVPKKPNLAERAARPALVATAATAAIAALSRSTQLRSFVADSLRRSAETMRSSNGSSTSNASSSSNGHSSGNGANKLSGQTRAELYELAKKAGVPGRSQMTKEELAKALKR